MKYSDLKEHGLGTMCRSCINKVFGIRKKLVREDCIYNPYQGKCTNCGDMRNIVRDLRTSGRFKIISGKVPDHFYEE